MAQALQAQGYEHDDAWDVNWLRVDETHELYYEQYGSKEGKAGMYTFNFLHVIVVDFAYSDLSSRSMLAERPSTPSTATCRNHADWILIASRVRAATLAKGTRRSSTQSTTA